MGRSGLAVLLAIACLAVAAPARAQADFKGQSVDDTDGVAPRALVSNDRGDRAVVYGVGGINGSLRVAFAPAGRPFGPPRDVPGSEGFDSPKAAVGPDGDVLIAWYYDDRSDPNAPDGGCCRGLRATVMRNGGDPKPATTIWPVGTTILEARLDILDPRHFGIVAGARGGIEASFATAGGGFGRPERVDDRDRLPHLLTVGHRGARLVYQHDLDLRERVRTSAGHWSRSRLLMNGAVEQDSPDIRIEGDGAGGVIAAWTAQTRAGASLRVATNRVGGRVRVRIVDRVSRPTFRFMPDLETAQNGAALVTWRLGQQFYRAERPAHRSFSGRRLAFAFEPDAIYRGFGVSPTNRWVAAVQTGGRFKDDAVRLRAITARFGGPPSRMRLVATSDASFASTYSVLPPVFDRSGRITFVPSSSSGIGAISGR